MKRGLRAREREEGGWREERDGDETGEEKEIERGRGQN